MQEITSVVTFISGNKILEVFVEINSHAQKGHADLLVVGAVLSCKV